MIRFAIDPGPLAPGPRGRPVEAGQVVCPEHGLVDLETCFTCRRYDGMTGAGPVDSMTEVRCAPTSITDILSAPLRALFEEA